MSESLENINLSSLKKYLLAHGWVKASSANSALERFQLPLEYDQLPFDLFLPANSNFISGNHEFDLIIANVADLCGISTSQLLSKLRLPEEAECFPTLPEDLFTSRILTKKSINRGLPVASRVAMFTNWICKAMRHAFEANVKLGNRFGDYLEPLAALPTSGSYEINIVAQLDIHENQSTNRLGLERLLIGLNDTSIATSEGITRAIINNTERGLSPEMCADLAEALEELDSHEVEFRVAWSDAIPVSEDVRTLSGLTLSGRSIAILKSASQELSLSPPEPVTITAEVLELRRYQAVKVKIIDTDLVGQRAFVELFGLNHEQAADAYKKSHPIKISGSRSKSGTTNFINEVISIEIDTSTILKKPNIKPRKLPAPRASEATRERDKHQGSYNKRYPSVMIYLRRAVQLGDVPEEFTLTDYRDWLKEHHVRRKDNKKEYNPKGHNATLNTHVRGYNTTARGREIGELERFTKDINGKSVYFYRFIDLWKYTDDSLP